MGGRVSSPISYSYYDVDIPQDARRQINDKNNEIWYDRSVKIPGQNNQINDWNRTIVNDRKTQAGLDKQVAQNTTTRNNLNQNISDLTYNMNDVDVQATSEQKTNKNNRKITNVNRNVIQTKTVDLNDNTAKSIKASGQYYSGIIEQNNLLSKTLTQTGANLTTNDRKSSQKDDVTALYDTFNNYLFYLYYIFLAGLIYVYAVIQIKMNRYIRIAIVVALALYPFLAYTIVQGLIYLYRRIVSFVLAIPYVPDRQQ